VSSASVTRDELPASSSLEPAELAPGVLMMFSGRAGGVSEAPYDTLNLARSVGDDAAAVEANRERVAQACGVPVSRLTWMSQVHGRTVADARAISPGAPPEADGMFTDAPGQVLGVMAADCAPVLLADPVARIVGVAHAGREGMAAGVVTQTVAAMSAAGADAGRMHAVIGPHICGACYEVPGPLQARVAAVVPEAACITTKGTPGIDIRKGIRAQLARAGVPSVSADPRCTAQAPGLYSYRRDGRTGRFAGFIWLAS
jgi:polyphenol oxidase